MSSVSPRIITQAIGRLLVEEEMRRLENDDPPRRFKVDGESMSPTLEDGQQVLLMPSFLHNGSLRRGDVVVLRQLVPPWDWIIKRVVGMPDESISLDGARLYVDDVIATPDLIPAGPDGKINGKWWNGPDEYFVLGDNPSRSTDSRTFGPVSSERILGRVWLRCWPPGAWGRVK